MLEPLAPRALPAMTVRCAFSSTCCVTSAYRFVRAMAMLGPVRWPVDAMAAQSCGSTAGSTTRRADEFVAASAGQLQIDAVLCIPLLSCGNLLGTAHLMLNL